MSDTSTLVTKHFAGLFNGVSQQAPTLRLETQAQSQINGLSSLVTGLTTRPPTRFIKNVGYSGGNNSLYHSIDRDALEKYIMGIHSDGSITVNCKDGYTYPVTGLTNHSDYLSVDVPRNDLAVTTIADYTLIVNKKKQVDTEMTYEVNSSVSPAQCIVTGLGEDAGTFYIMDEGSTIASALGTKEVNGVTVNRTVTEVLEDLRDQVNANIAFSASLVSNNSFTYRKVNGDNFNPTVDGYLNAVYNTMSEVATQYDTIAYVYVAKGVAEQTYKVVIDGRVRATYSTGTTDQADTYKTDTIAHNLWSDLVNSGYSTQLEGSVIKVWKADGSDFEFDVHDSWGDMAIKGFKGRAQSFKELPAKCFEGATLQIVGKSDSDEGSYWVKYVTSYVRDGADIQTTGVWKEAREPNKEHKFDLSTMPIQVLRKQDRTLYEDPITNPDGIYFSVEYAYWAERMVGDAISAPHPSFVGGYINDIFLFGNRLGVLTGQSVVLSKTGDFFNFYPATVTDLLDDGPIDIDAPSLNVTTLSHAIPSREHLMIFSSRQQFILTSGGEPLTPTTATISSILQYPCDTRVTPISLGQMAYFMSPRGSHMSVREYFIQSDGMVSDAPNVMDHVPKLIKSSELKPMMVGVPNEDILFITNGGTELYVYKFNWVGDQKSQSSWSKWEFARNIVTIHEFDNKLYIIFDDGSLEYMDFELDLSNIYVDSMEPIASGSTVNGAQGLVLYNTDGSILQELPEGSLVTEVDTFKGYKYSFEYEFSPLYLKLSQDGLGEIEGSSLLRRLKLFLEGHTSIKMIVKDINRDKVRIEYNYTTPEDKADRYSRSFLLRGDSKDSTVTIKSTSDRAVVLQSASFEILTTNRARKI